MAGVEMEESLMGAIGRTIERFYPDLSPFDVFPIAKKVAEMIQLAVEKEMMEERRTTPYKPSRDRRGRTESAAQQKAAGMAWSCRKKRGEERKKCADKLESYGGAAWDLYSDEITNPQLKRLATIRGGAEIPKSANKPGKKRKALPKKLSEQ